MARQMKDSGVEWIGEIPKDWKIRKIKNIADIYTGNSIKDNEKEKYLDSENAIPYISTKEIDLNTSRINYTNGMYTKKGDCSFKVAKKGSTLMCIEGGSAGKKISYLLQDVSFVNKLCCFRSNIINDKFLYYYLKSPNFNSEFKLHINGLIGGVSKSEIREFFIVYPNEIEQQKISDFLDEKVGEIDSVITKTKDTIEDYKKYKQAIIDQMVINEGIPRYKFRYLGELKNGLNYHTAIKTNIIKFLGVGDFRNFMVLNEKGNFSDLPIDTKIPEEYLLKSGDIVFVRSNGSKELVGRSIMVNNVDYDLTYSGFCIRFRNKHTEIVNNKYLLYFFRSEYFKRLLCMGSNGMAINNLNQDVLNSVRVPVPSMVKQQEIVKYLDEKCSEIDKLIVKKEELLSDLEDYKKSLIYEYVTGKKEIK